MTLIARGEGGGRVGGRWEIHYYALKYTDFIFLIVRMIVMGVFFFFREKMDVPGLYNCKLKNEMTLILKFGLAKIKQPKLARWALASLYTLLA